MLSLIIFLLLFMLELIYFRLADYFDIIDHPNDRSSHKVITIRGGGVIFPLSLFLYFASYGDYSWFILGLAFISLISFWDDVKSLPNLVRIGVHVLAVTLLVLQFNIPFPAFCYPLILLLIIGTLNAYNFMDGINGITGGYSFIALVSLHYINESQSHFINSRLIEYLLLAVAVFIFFNFRKEAKCFAGDIGSISIAFAICFLIGKLIIHGQDVKYILLLLIYGLDTVTTIIFRMIRRENIFEAHRTHFYQYLANELKFPQLYVAGLYCSVQLMVNLAIIFLLPASASLWDNLMVSTFFIAVTGGIFLMLRLGVEGKERLLSPSRYNRPQL